MNGFKSAALSVAVGLAMSASAMGGTMSEAQYKSVGETISAKHRADEAACQAMAGNTKDVCMAEAKGRESVSKAERVLKTADVNATAQDAKAEASKKAAATKQEAAYAVAKEKCDSLAADAQDKCIKDAKALHGQT